jgi:PAS domain S-box-containing protein
MQVPGTKNTFIIIISSLIVFWLVTVLFFFDRWNRLIHFSLVNHEIANIRYNFSHYRDAFDLTTFKPGFSDDNNASYREQTQNLFVELQASLDIIEKDFSFSNDPSITRKVKTVKESLDEISLLLTEYESLQKITGTFYSGTLGRTREIFNDLSSIRTTGFFSQYYPLFIQFLINPDPLIPEEISDAWIIRKEHVFRELPPSVMTKHGPLSGEDIKLYCEELMNGISELAIVTRKIGSPGKGGITGDIFINNSRIDGTLSEMKASVESAKTQFIAKMKTGLLLWLLISGALFLYLLHALSLSIHKNLHEIEDITMLLGKGGLPSEISISGNDEFGKIQRNLNDLVHLLRLKTAFADKIAEGDFNANLMPASEVDILGASLLKLSGKLAEAEKEEFRRKEEEKRHSWTSEGLAKFGDIFRSERENVKELSYKVIFNLVKYLDAAAGSIYLTVDENKPEPEYEMTATFAWDRRKFIQKRILLGEGLVGVCALEKETIYLTEIPENYLEISSGLTEIKPGCLLFVPLKLENEILGVIEIAAIKKLHDFEVRFVEQLGEITATTLAAVKANENTSLLLEQSRKQTDEMQKQEERMRQNMDALERSQEESLRKETEISGLLNAVNASSLVAEFSVNGHFANINDKLQLLLESPRDQIIGKHHSDFAVTDKYSSNYKDFWKDLRNGKTIQITEKYRLYSGVEIWLEETFSAILDNENNPLKILDIAHDITHSKNQQEALINQSGEIKRRGSEIESFSIAVGNSMIQCEMTHEGEILSVNTNYMEMSGYSRKELLGKNIRIFLRDTEKENFENIWSEVVKHNTYSGAIRRTKPTGEEVWLMATFSPVLDENSNLYKVYFLALDITEKRLKYQLLEEANKEIERLRDRINKLETE